MSKPDQGNQQDQRGSAVEDSNSMTIEYLRARLLAERSVSKSARQRADELAERVMELEEQLRIVYLQRLKAEKATADVLAILDDHGLSDVSDTDDSNSDPDTPSESRMSPRGVANSKGRRHESELLGSDLEFSPSPGRSLSWKGRTDSAYSAARYQDPLHRRRNSLASVGPYQRHRTGKSCRQIRRKESRSGPEEFKANAIKLHSPSKVNSKMGGGDVVEGSGEKFLLEAPVLGHTEKERNTNGIESDYGLHGRDGDMEKALEQQAQLISEYEELEKAQREWEEKFRENNSSTPDSCDPGNRSDVTEERYEINAQASHSLGTNAKAEAASKFNASAASPSLGDVGPSKEWKNSGTPASEFVKGELEALVEKGKQKSESFKSEKQLHLHGSPNDSHSHGSHDLPLRPAAPTFSSNTGTTSSKEEVPQSHSELHALVPQKGSDELGSILEALKLAKQSLQQKMTHVPVVEGGSVGPPLPGGSLRGMVDTAVGCTGLLRLPTDFGADHHSEADIPSSSAQLGFGNYYSDAATALRPQFVASPFMRMGTSLTNEDHFNAMQLQSGPLIPTRNPYLGPSIFRSLPSSGSSYIPTEDQYITFRSENGGPKIHAQKTYLDHSSNTGSTFTGGYIFQEGEIPSRPYINMGPGFGTQRLHSDPYFDTGILTSTRYASTTYPNNLSYHGSMPRIPTKEGFSGFLPSSRLVAMPPAGQLQFSNEQIIPEMYRYQ